MLLTILFLFDFTFKIVIASICLDNLANNSSPYSGTKYGSQLFHIISPRLDIPIFSSPLPPAPSHSISLSVSVSPYVNTLIISKV